MPCLLALIAVFFPRMVIVLLFLFSDYLARAYETTLWPVLGFLFAPFTTLAYALGMNANAGSISGIYLIIVIIAVLMDLGAWGGSGTASRRRRA